MRLWCVVFFTAVADGAVPERRGPLEITRVGLDRKSFNPSKGETVTLGFEITKQANVKVEIYDRLGQEVRSFDMPGIEAGRPGIGRHCAVCITNLGLSAGIDRHADYYVVGSECYSQSQSLL